VTPRGHLAPGTLSSVVFQAEGLREDGMPVPDGASQVEYVEVTA